MCIRIYIYIYIYIYLPTYFPGKDREVRFRFLMRISELSLGLEKSKPGAQRPLLKVFYVCIYIYTYIHMHTYIHIFNIYIYIHIST